MRILQTLQMDSRKILSFVFLLIISSLPSSFSQTTEGPKLPPKPKPTLPPISTNPDDVKLYLITTDKGSVVQFSCINFRDDDSILKHVGTSFLRNRTSTFIIHGFGGDGTYEAREEGIPSGVPSNSFYFSWSKSSGSGRVPPYEKTLDITLDEALLLAPTYVYIVKVALPIVWRRVGEYISWLTDLGLVIPQDVHVVGHSLGAHVAGGAGRIYRDMQGSSFARITGLDPAGPLFDPSLIPMPPYVQRQLTFADADFVDCYHTNAGMMGNANYVNCHVDFKINNGINQPGCISQNNSIGMNVAFPICSHIYAINFYSLSDSVEIYGCRCPASFVRGSILDCQQVCPFPVRAGFFTPRSARGYRHVDYNYEIPARKAYLRGDECKA